MRPAAGGRRNSGPAGLRARRAWRTRRWRHPWQRRAQPLVPAGIAAQGFGLFVGVTLVFPGQFPVAGLAHGSGELPPGTDGQHTVGGLRLPEIGGFETRPEPLVPAVEPEPGQRVVVVVGGVEFPAGVFGQQGERLRIVRIVVVIQQAQHPIERVAGDAVVLRRGVEQVLADEREVAEGGQRRGLRRIGVARP